jgi:hypothetical protein
LVLSEWLLSLAISSFIALAILAFLVVRLSISIVVVVRGLWSFLVISSRSTSATSPEATLASSDTFASLSSLGLFYLRLSCSWSLSLLLIDLLRLFGLFVTHIK